MGTLASLMEETPRMELRRRRRSWRCRCGKGEWALQTGGTTAQVLHSCACTQACTCARAHGHECWGAGVHVPAGV